MQRPRFSPSSCGASTTPLTSPDETWLPLVCCPADAGPEWFEPAVEQLVDHPEYNSTLILRSETLGESVDPALALDAHRPVRTIRRQLLPRRPDRDRALEQRCTFYAAASDVCTLVLSPVLAPGESLPYYHPPVRHLALRFVAGTHPALRIEAVVLPDTPTGLDSRLYRTALALLEAVHRYSWGARTHYQKRVRHDCILPREPYQDLYLAMRARHKHAVAEWKESTDPLKHVYEDIGIATYLMLLWKRTYADTGGQPPGGFLDLGCGNGLLTHILVSEGYRGHGLDLRARTSWAHYPDRTRAALHVHALDPTSDGPVPHLAHGAFLIGNHADELTPWLPLIATREHAAGYLSIPCCAWSFDERFARASAGSQPWDVAADDDAFIDRLNLGPEGARQSQYAAYRIWLARLSQWTGWKIECDTLRIPSTRNWAILGRERLDDDDHVYVERALDIVRGVIKRGAFKPRTPEGKAGGH